MGTNTVTITDITELDVLDSSNFVNSFVACKGRIFEYTQSGIVTCLTKRDCDTLTALWVKLYDGVKTTFLDFALRLPMNRKAKHLMVPDIFHLGYSLTNNSPSRDLDKVLENQGKMQEILWKQKMMRLKLGPVGLLPV